MFDTLKVTLENGIYLITLNRPHVKNAFSFKGYSECASAIRKGCADESVRIIAITGEGSFYSSGNDLSNFTSTEPNMTDPQGPFKSLVQAFIDANKPLIAFLNGPAIGIAATTLGLCDSVYATESAYISTPFSRIGLCAEGCASYTFPKIMGYQKGNEFLLWGRKVSAREACDWGLVTEVFSDQTFHSRMKAKLSEYAALPKGSLMATKRLVRGAAETSLLHKICLQESDEVLERTNSDEAREAVVAFMSRRKSKL